MSKLIEDADVITEIAGQIAALAEGFDPEIRLPDDNGCCGGSREQIGQAAKSMQKAQEALRELMVQTVAFLQAKGASITKADVQEAAGLLNEEKFFG